MKVIYLNVSVGCKEAERYRKLVAFIKKQSPDVLGLSELNGWDKNNFAKLSKFKDRTGLKFSIFCRSPHGYHLALFSKKRLKVKYLLEKGMWHGAIISVGRYDGKTYNFVLTHLSPISEEFRLEDLRILLGKLKTKQRTFLMGDMNSISPQDIINEASVSHQAKKKGIKKFGVDRIEKRVITTLLKRGFLDTSHLSGQKSAVYSVPTVLEHDTNHFTRLHLDYIFITGNLKKKVKRSGVLRNKETDRLSDHYPVFVQL